MKLAALVSRFETRFTLIALDSGLQAVPRIVVFRCQPKREGLQTTLTFEGVHLSGSPLTVGAVCTF